MGRTPGGSRLAGMSQRGQIIDQVTQHEQIDEVAEAVVRAADRPFAHRVQLLRDLEAQRQASDYLRAREPEVLQADRIDVLGLVGAVLGPGDLETNGGPRPRLVRQTHVQARRVRAVLGRGAATKGELAVRRGERCVQRVEQLVGFASEDDVDVLGGASCGPHAKLNRHATFEQEARTRRSGRCAFQRTEQRHGRDPSPHAISGDTVYMQGFSVVGETAPKR